MKPTGLIAAAALLMCASAAFAGNDPPPLDRPTALLRAQSFQNQIEAALTQPMHDLYVKAKTGAADDTWVYGLALFATRSNRDDVPQAELKIYDGYMARVDAARRVYAWKHRGVDTLAMSPDQFVKPSEIEHTAIVAVDAIISPDIWLDKASDANDLQGNPAIDPPVLAQSQGCVQAVHDDLDANHALVYILNKMGAAPNGIISRPPEEINPDGEAMCGGKEAFAHYKALMSLFYQSSLQVNDYVNY